MTDINPNLKQISSAFSKILKKLQTLRNKIKNSKNKIGQEDMNEFKTNRRQTVSLIKILEIIINALNEGEKENSVAFLKDSVINETMSWLYAYQNEIGVFSPIFDDYVNDRSIWQQSKDKGYFAYKALVAGTKVVAEAVIPTPTPAA